MEKFYGAFGQLAEPDAWVDGQAPANLIGLDSLKEMQEVAVQRGHVVTSWINNKNGQFFYFTDGAQ